MTHAELTELTNIEEKAYKTFKEKMKEAKAEKYSKEIENEVIEMYKDSLKDEEWIEDARETLKITYQVETKRGKF